jgi:glutaconate CoA-transferase subunit A
VITAERLVTNFTIRSDPAQTVIPFYLVDAVVEAPYGSYPGNMPYLYFSDEEHLAAWMKAEKDPAEFDKFLEHFIYGVTSFEEYLERCGGLRRLKELQKQESLVDK